MACSNSAARGGDRAIPRLRPDARACGASLIDVLVGLAVGLVATIIVYQTFLALDGIRRTAAATADLQSGGAFALFALATQIGNAGAGLSSAARWLDTCPPTADIATSLRPIDVLITDGGRADAPDSLVVRQALATAVGMPAAFASPAPAGANFRIESPDGFAPGDRVVAISRTGVCAMSQVTAVGAPAGGVVDIAHAPVAVDLPATSVLLNLGASGRASTTRYDVVSGTLRSTDLANGDAPAPLVPNIVNLKFQYGVDVDGDGILDTWAGAGASGAWAPATLLAAPRATLQRIKAVRIGIVARSERPDRTLTRAYQWVLFDCASDDKASCPGRLAGTIAGSASGSYRYRTYETIVPLRNVIWNRGR
ncbi:MAG TPA: PilW family protein [Casimicrobiaceae bacterium]